MAEQDRVHGGDAAERLTFGALLRRHRDATGLTLEALAERAEMSVRALIYLERDAHRPYAATVQRLVDALALPPVDRGALALAARQPGVPNANAASTLSTLPWPPTPLIGRQHAVAEVTRLLRTTRLLTLTGAGGVGKTRLAWAVAAKQVDVYADGVLYVDLAPLADPRLVPAALALAVGVRESAGRPVLDRMVAALRSRQVLLVMDNSEHLLDACAQLIDTLLRTCPHLQVLATSRGALGIAGERVWRVPSLALPPSAVSAPPERLRRYAAVRLFVERAAAVCPDFVLTAANAPAVTAICRRLDGIPLAIELAAARVGVLSPAQIATRLDDCFLLLTGGSRTALPRHQTLRALVDWSYALLSPPEQTLLRRLAVFAGGWTLTAAETVCTDAGLPTGAMLDLLAGLVDQSLVVVDASEEEVRHRFLETIRQYAAMKLTEAGERAALCRAQWVWSLSLTEGMGRGDDTALRSAIARLEADYDNVRAALAWSLEQQDQGAAVLRLTTALCDFWAIHHGVEGRMWLDRALAHASVTTTPARAEALSAAGWLAWSQADRRGAYARYHEALALWRALGDQEGKRRILVLLGLPGMYPADHDTAYAIMATAVTTGDALPAGVAALWSDRCTLWRAAKDDRTMRSEAMTSVLLFLSQIDRARGDYAAARSWLERSVALLGAGGPTGLLVFHLCDLCITLARLGDAATFEARLADARALIPHIAEDEQRAYALHSVAYVAWLHGADTMARALWEANLALVRAQGDDERTLWPLMHLGDVAWQQGDLQAARVRYEESLGLAQAVGQQSGMATMLHRLGRIALVDGRLARAEELAAQSLELARELDAGWHVVNALTLQADVALARGDLAHASALYRASLRQLRTLGEIDGAGQIALHCIDGRAAVAAHTGATDPAQRVHAARLYAASTALRRVPGAARAPADEAVHGPIIAALHTAPGATTQESAELEKQPMSLAQVVADALAPSTSP